MPLEITIALLIAAFLLAAFANYKSRQPLELGETRWIPYLGVQFVAVLAIIMMIAHLITLITGQPFVGRMGT
ncbi:MAG: hypothetical protein ACE5EM_03310 [Sphingomonadales bacterium]